MNSDDYNFARFAPSSDDADTSRRSQTHRDRDRVLYSEAFRRLGGVTQVALGRPELVLHNRLTHSLKVEQVGLAIYSMLNEDPASPINADPHAIAAACLAHDLGHPPFGHAAETELNELLTCDEHRLKARKYQVRIKQPCPRCHLEDGFEGNAQSFRIVARLASHRRSDGNGLNLTRRSLAALTKYPWLRGENPGKHNKWGAYDCDVGSLKFALGRDPYGNSDADAFRQTLDAAIMDWADDISYAVHDIEDFYRSGLIPLSDYRFEPDSDTLEKFLSYLKDHGKFNKDDIYEPMKRMWPIFPTSIYTGSEENHEALDRARSILLTRFINAAQIENDQLIRDPEQERLNSLVKQLIWFHVIDGPRLSNIQVGQRKVVRDLYETLRPLALNTYKVSDEDASEITDPQMERRLPYNLTVFIRVALSNLGTYTREMAITRGLVDFISSLSDEDAYYHHAVLYGSSTHSSL